MDTCKNCKEPIDRNGSTYWVHSETRLVTCENGETQAQEDV